METVYIDGSFGEGGGQVLRTSLTLAAITGKRLHIDRIRANRPKPGLSKQHLTCVEAICEVCGGKSKGFDKLTAGGAAVGSTELEFEPGEIRAGDYRFDIGSAGSASLVVQTVLPVLFCTGDSSRIAVTGGTHNAWAPPFDFIEYSFLPAIAAAGFKADCRLTRYGFFPAGGGEIAFEIQPKQEETEGMIDLSEPIMNSRISAKIYTSKLPIHIADKQRKLLLSSGLDFETIEHIEVKDSVSAGNCAVIYIKGFNRTIVFTGFGSKGKPSEKVINEVVSEAREYLDSSAAIDHYLADQLLIYIAMRKNGRFTTNELSSHLTTNIEVIKKFLLGDFAVAKRGTVYEVCCQA
jgi:RNA 3'-terminal phosphate cyclase (ATP)